MNINDPTVYPVTFSIGKRSTPVVENRTAVTTFFASGTRKIEKAIYFYSENYLTDVNISSSQNTRFISDGKRASFEVTASSMDFLSSELNLKIWTNERTFFVVNDLGYENLRQTPWVLDNTSCSFYQSSNLQRFNAVVVSGVGYYPLVNTTIDFYPDYVSSYTVPQIALGPGDSVQQNMIQKENYGVLSVIFKTSFEWYYDKDRTVPATPPSELSDLHEPSFGVRIFFSIAGKFAQEGAVSSDGKATFDGILTEDYVISAGVPYGSFSFLGYNSVSDVIFYSKKNEVIIDQNGYCIEPGNEGQIYLV